MLHQEEERPRVEQVAEKKDYVEAVQSEETRKKKKEELREECL